MKYTKMKNSRRIKSACIFLLSIVAFVGSTNAQNRDFYQFKIYSIENAQQEQRMDKYLENAYLPALKRAGIPIVGVFKPNEGDANQDKMIFVMIPFKSLEQFAKLSAKLLADEQYLKDGGDYIDAAHDNPPYSRIESILLRSFKDCPEFHIPEHSTPPSEQIYELRSYHGATEKLYERKVEMFNEGDEIEIFFKLDFQPVFFGEVISGASMPNLMYMTTHENTASRAENWKAFSGDPDWKALSGMEKYNNTVSHIDIYMLHPTEYSGI